MINTSKPSQTPANLPPPAARPFTLRSSPVGYALVPQLFLAEVKKRLGIMLTKVKLIKDGVKPWVQREIRKKMRGIKNQFDRFE